METAPPPPDDAREPVVLLVPQPRHGLPKVVGPGRRERDYLGKLARLEEALLERQRELEATALVERGSSRRLDRMERKLAAIREAALALEQKEHRLILALGALQRENELLRGKLALPGAATRRAALPARRSLLARLFARA